MMIPLIIAEEEHLSGGVFRDSCRLIILQQAGKI